MKLARVLLILLVIVVLGAMSASAQGIDRDDDGVPFRLDQCPGVAGLPSNNGCPLDLVAPLPPPPVDTDGDGLPDSDDQCPAVAGAREDRGCPDVAQPETDSDGDGTPDSGDECPSAPGPRENRGCPPVEPPAADVDADGLPDGEDACPTVAGVREHGGCPAPENPSTLPEPQPVPDSSVPPFLPPLLPADGCYVTPANPNTINVRNAPNMSADIIGSLLPGIVYAADGYVLNGMETWYILSVYENSAGLTGYASSTVVLASGCAQTNQTDPAPGMNELANPQAPLCYLSVGYDAASWGSSVDPQLGNESVVYGAFYFAIEPGQPIPAGTPISGVIFLDGYHLLPPESPLFFENPDSAVAVASNPSVIAAAVNGGVGTAFNMAFPNPNGGVMATNGTTFYRLSSPEHVGNCGPIVGAVIDDFVQADNTVPGGTQALECFTRPGTTIVSDCWCETSDTECVDTLVSICWGGGAYIDAGPDMTACWYDDTLDPGSTLTAVAQRATLYRDICADDLTVWWIELPNPYGDPFELHDIGLGNCEATFDAALDARPLDGHTRLIMGTAQGIYDPTDGEDCDGNGIPDGLEFPAPTCSGDLTTGLPDTSADKETPGWWRDVLDRTCGTSDWIIMTEIDEDGDEVVTDAQCVDDIE